MILLSSVAALTDHIEGSIPISERDVNRDSSSEQNPFFLAYKMTEEICRQLVEQLPIESKFSFVSVNVRKPNLTSSFLLLSFPQELSHFPVFSVCLSVGLCDGVAPRSLPPLSGY